MRVIERARQAAKLTLATSLQYSGAMSLIRARRLQNRAVILMYHRIIPESEARFDYAPTGMVVTTPVFDMHMRHLARTHKTVTMPELVTLLDSGEAQDRPLAAVTFDDGWLDNYTNAFPLLQRHQVPATIFIASNFIDDKEYYWLERMKLVLAHAHRVLVTESIPLGQRDALKKALAALNVTDLAGSLHPRLGMFLTSQARNVQSLGLTDRCSYLEKIEQIASLAALPDTRYFMNWNEIRTLRDEGITIGAHTTTHTELTSVDASHLQDEIGIGKARLEEELQQTVDHFAYPYGKHNKDIQAAIAANGFSSACTTVNGLVNRDTGRLLLNRVNMHTSVSMTRSMFAYRAMGL